ncbi:MAG: type II toxin-antitoxin system RelE/ParE family toxin [Patescibacteria group bacterium]
MGITYRVVCHEQVIARDIPLLSREWRGKIKSAIETKLVSRPEVFGIPLRNTLKGYRKLRVGNYRIIFRIESKTIKIFVVGHRRSVYHTSNKRMV